MSRSARKGEDSAKEESQDEADGQGYKMRDVGHFPPSYCKSPALSLSLSLLISTRLNPRAVDGSLGV